MFTIVLISIGEGKNVNLDNLNDYSHRKKYCVWRINSTHTSVYFGEFVVCFMTSVVRVVPYGGMLL
jgi:hypothetical protein